MKNMIKVLGVIVLVTVIGLPLMAGGGSQSSSSSGTSSRGTITTAIITGIPAQYDGKFAMLTIDMNNRNQAWGMLTITDSTATFNLLDWVTDQPTAIAGGNYGVNIIIADNMTAISNDQFLYVGVILSKALSGETVTVGFGEFVSP